MSASGPVSLTLHLEREERESICVRPNQGVLL